MLVVNYEQILRAVFSCFHGQKPYIFIFYIVGFEIQNTKVKKNLKRFGKYFFGVKNVFFRASCFGFIIKGHVQGPQIP